MELAVIVLILISLFLEVKSGMVENIVFRDRYHTIQTVPIAHHDCHLSHMVARGNAAIIQRL